MNIIGINGLKRSGKGEVGNIISSELPNVRHIGFADKLKVYTARSLGYDTLSDEAAIDLMDKAKERWTMDVYAYAGKIPDELLVAVGGGSHARLEKELTVRELLQRLGTEARNLFGEDFWVNQVLPAPIGPDFTSVELAFNYPGVDTLVFSDVRFNNEAKRIRDLGGKVIYVRRPGTLSDGHASEQPLDNDLIDYRIVNDRSIVKLRRRTGTVLKQMGLLQ